MTMFGATDYALHPASAEVLCINCIQLCQCEYSHWRPCEGGSSRGLKPECGDSVITGGLYEMLGQIMRSHQTLPRDVGVYKMFQGRSSGKGSEAAASRGLECEKELYF